MERGVRGIFNTIIKSIENLLESNVINLIMKEGSSLVTGGTYVNTGHTYGLWKIFQDYRLEKFIEPVAPPTYNMILCSQFKSGMKASSNKISEIKKMLMTLSGISPYFAKSGIRYRELKTLQIKITLLFAHFQKYLK